MKLSELVAFKIELDRLSAPEIQFEANLKLSIISHLAESSKIQFGNCTETIKNNQASINQAFDNFENSIQVLKSQIKKQIEQDEKHWFQESYRLFEDQEMGFSSLNPDLVLNRRLTVTDTTMDFYRSRVMLYADWRYPGMIIHPGLEDFIKHMVMFDPLYLVDVDYNNLKPAIEQFVPEYQRRLRPYVLKRRGEVRDIPMLAQIPDNQMGICLVVNWFNYRPLELIKKYLIEIYQKLRPGGTLLMTFNDCDREKAVMLVEAASASYIPGSLLVELIASIGYEITLKWDDGGPTTWLEVKKPGELTSLRGGQTLAKIVPK